MSDQATTPSFAARCENAEGELEQLFEGVRLLRRMKAEGADDELLEIQEDFIHEILASAADFWEAAPHG